LLSVGDAVPGVLAGGSAFTWRLPGGGPFRLLLDQHEHDFSIELLSRDGRLLRAVDGFDYGAEQATAGDTAAAAVRIRRADNSTAAASFTLRLEAMVEDAAALIGAEDLSSQARAAQRRGDARSLREAAEAWRRAAEAWSSLHQPGFAVRSRIAEANTLHALNEYAAARQLYGDALARSRDSGDLRSVIECLNNRGVGYWQQGDFTRAATDFNEAMQLWDRLPTQDGRTGTLVNQGLLSWQVGAYQEALDRFLEARRSAAALQDRHTLPYIVNNLALTYGALGEFARSAALFESAADLFRAGGDSLGAGRALAYSARVCLRLGAVSRARANLDRGLPLIERAGDRRGLAEAWDLAGEVDARSGRFESAVRRQRNALAMFRILGDRRGEANALANLGITSLARGDPQTGAEWLREALPLHRDLGTPFSEAAVLYHLAMAESRTGDLANALRHSGEAVDRAERLRGSVAAESLRVSFLGSTYEYYRENIGLLMRSSQPELRDRAWSVAERSRARALLDARQADEPVMADRSRALNAQLVRLAAAPAGNGDLRRAVNRSLEELAEAQSRARGDRASLVSAAAIPALPEVQAALAEGDALIEYALGRAGSFAWVIQPDSVAAFGLPPAETIERPTREMTEAVNSWSADHGAEADARFHKAAAALAAAVVYPLLPGLHARRLLVVPDGALSTAPWAALPLPDGRPLVARFSLATAPSAAVFLALHRSAAGHPAGPPHVAIVADPVFDAGDPRVGRAGASGGGFAVSAGMGRLLFSRKEALSIASLLPPGTSHSLLGFDAVKSSLSEGALSGYNVLHISTHGLVDLDRPERSALVFSQVDAHGTPRDGRLTLGEIYNLRLDADLVALSACQTAFGKEVRGEGVISLGYGFLYAGARRVAASLWRVDDEATAELWRIFYTHWLRNPGEAPSSLLRQAQLELRASPQWRSPYYWGSLVIEGEP
jgi:CHAT domain-containing protein